MRARLLIVAILAAAAVAVSQAPALAIHRAVVLARGRAWLVDGIPYSQSRYHDGYRTDCSGFVSMCWSLANEDGEPLSLSTRTIPTSGEATRIPTSALQPGDIMDDPGHHTFIFVAWTNPFTKSALVTMEEAGSAWGTICRIRQTAGLGGYRAYKRIGIEINPPYERYLERVERTAFLPDLPDRYSASTMASVISSKHANALVVACADDYMTAVTAPALAGTVKGPVLFVKKDSIPARTAAEIKRLGPKGIYLIGSGSVITTATKVQIGYLGPRIERVSGANPILTSIAVAKRTVQLMGKDRAGKSLWDGTLVLGNAYDRSDNLSVASLSARKRWPLLLTGGRGMSTDTRLAIAAMKPRTIVIVGGDSVIADATVKDLRKTIPYVYRLAGADRYATSIRMAERAVASGAKYYRMGLVPEDCTVDVLAGSVASARLGTFALQVPRRYLDTRIGAVLKARPTWFGKVRIFGSDIMIDYTVRQAVWDILAGRS